MKYKINFILSLYFKSFPLLLTPFRVLFCLNSIILSLDKANNYIIVFKIKEINEE